MTDMGTDIMTDIVTDKVDVRPNRVSRSQGGKPRLPGGKPGGKGGSNQCRGMF